MCKFKNANTTRMEQSDIFSIDQFLLSYSKSILTSFHCFL